MKNYILKVAIIIAVFFGINTNTYSLSKEKSETSVSDNRKLPINWISVIDYGSTDAGGAWALGSWGSSGGPMGTALGIVVGGCVSSGWKFVKEHQGHNRLITQPTNSEATDFSNEYERAGYLHNKFLVSFINSHQQTFSTEEAFVNAIYTPLIDFVSFEYKISVKEVQTNFKKTDLINLCKSFTSANNISDYGQIIVSNGGSDNLRNEYIRIVNQLSVEHLKGVEFFTNYINNEINKFASNDFLNEQEKLVSIYSCNIFKYSLFLWSAN